MTRLVVPVIAALLLVGCSAGPFGNPVFVGAEYEDVQCPDGGTCLRVFSEVDGTREGVGSCILYATTGAEGARVAVAASGDLPLVPETTVQWMVRVPRHLDGWNPVCTPTAEG